MRFLRFWWDFVVGDDWVAAVGVLLGIALTSVLGAWWVLPPVVAAVLTLSVARATRR